jgi:spore germination protein
MAVALLVVLVGVPGAVIAMAQPSAVRVHHHGGIAVTGYAGDWTSDSVLDAQAPALTDVGVFGIDVATSGDAVAPPSSAALGLLDTAHADGLGAELLVDNGAGDPTTVASRLLTSRAHRARVVAQIVGLVTAEGWNGVTVDLESLAPRDAQGLVGFVARLRSKLPARDELAVDVTATPTRAEYPELGYHLAGLAKVAQVVLMAYDEDGPWSGPGPIGGLPWQRASIAAVLHDVPAHRLVLGVATYGYSWPSGARVHDGVAVTDGGAAALASRSDRRPRWVRVQGEWTVRLRDGTVLWWSDARSVAVRLKLARADRLAGVAVWQLSSANLLPVQ